MVRIFNKTEKLLNSFDFQIKKSGEQYTCYQGTTYPIIRHFPLYIYMGVFTQYTVIFTGIDTGGPWHENDKKCSSGATLFPAIGSRAQKPKICMHGHRRPPVGLINQKMDLIFLPESKVTTRSYDTLFFILKEQQYLEQQTLHEYINSSLLQLLSLRGF